MTGRILLIFAFGMAATGLPCGIAAEQQSILTFHGQPGRNGNFVVPALTFERARRLRLDQDFQARFPGHVYAQPLYWRVPGASSGMLLIATEDDAVHALDAKTGK